MTNMDNWTIDEKLMYIPMLHNILTNTQIDEKEIEELPPNVRTAVRNLIRPDR